LLIGAAGQQHQLESGIQTILALMGVLRLAGNCRKRQCAPTRVALQL
jgi:hypothetical protein